MFPAGAPRRTRNSPGAPMVLASLVVRRWIGVMRATERMSRFSGPSSHFFFPLFFESCLSCKPGGRFLCEVFRHLPSMCALVSQTPLCRR